MTKWSVSVVVVCCCLLVCCGLLIGSAKADTLKSAHYQLNEPNLGSGGFNPSISKDFKTDLSVGQPAVGDAASNSFQIEAGAQTTKDPALSFAVINGLVSIGSFSPTAAATTSSQFSVLDYTSYGYAVQIIGTTPANGNYIIPAMTTLGASQPGTEQFGINLVKNNNFCGAGCNLGADPDHGQFGIGAAAAGYNTPNNFQYNSGDTIAIGPKSSGVSTYTISYIINVKDLTPGGQYTSSQSLVCTATF